MSRTMSTVCSISTMQGELSPGQIGCTSIAMLCQEASNSLWPSKRLDIPALPLQGRSFKKGVKFSVHTTSLGSVPWRRCKLAREAFEWSPTGSNVLTGLVVRVESTKFRDAQNRPDSALFKVIHRAKALILCYLELGKTRYRSSQHTLPLSQLPPKPTAQRLSPLLLHHPKAEYPNSPHPISQY